MSKHKDGMLEAFMAENLDPMKNTAQEILYAGLGFQEGYDAIAEQLNEANNVIKKTAVVDMAGVCMCIACEYLRKWNVE